MQPASRLKTPATPIWVTCCCGHYGVIFNSNRELLRNYHAEKRFELHHYTCGGCYISMTVDNRVQDDNDGHSRMMRESKSGSSGNNCNRNMDKRDEMIATPLEK
jgi:ubiquitin carboxyl-terminal hydrolase MINDY-3/4